MNTSWQLTRRLREERLRRGLTQKDVARQSGVGDKTISSFETGNRIGSLKISQLQAILGVYGMTEAEFFTTRDLNVRADVFGSQR